MKSTQDTLLEYNKQALITDDAYDYHYFNITIYIAMSMCQKHSSTDVHIHTHTLREFKDCDFQFEVHLPYVSNVLHLIQGL